MSSSYSTNLRLELMVNGEQGGTWGTVTNTNLGTLLEQAISGVSDVVFSSDADKTLSTVNGGTDEARQMIISLTSTVVGGLTATRNVIVPSVDKLYVVKNGTSGGRSIVVKTSAGSGVTITNGETTMVWCDGTNVYSALDYTPALTIGAGGLSLQGNFVVGGSTPSDAIGIEIDTTLATSSTTQYGVLVRPTYDDTATSSIYGYRSLLTGGVAASSYTTNNVFNYRSSDFTLGTNQKVTDFYGFYGDSLTAATNNYGVYLNTDATAAVSIATISGTGSTVTVDTSTAHGLVTGDKVFLANIPVALMTSGNYNGGPFTISVSDTDTFTFSGTSTSSSSITSGNVVKANNWNVYTAGTGNNLFGGPVLAAVSSVLPALRVSQAGSGDALVVEDSSYPDATPFRINSTGTVITYNAIYRGYDTSVAAGNYAGGTTEPLIQSHGTTVPTSGVGAYNWSSTATHSAGLYLAKSKSGTVGTRGVVSSGDDLGAIQFSGDDGTNFITGAAILAEVDGTPGTNDMPGRLMFYTTPDGSSTPAERFRIDASGNVGIGTTSPDGNFEVSGTATTQYITRYSTDTSSANLYFRKSRGTESAPTVLVSGDNIGTILFQGYDGSNFSNAAQILVDSDGTPGVGDMPGRMLFRLSPDGSSSVVTRVTILSTGYVGIGNTAPVCILDVTGGIQTSRTTVTAPATTDGNIFSGTYTPALTNVTNVATSTNSACQYMRVGNTVTVSGQVVIDPTTANTNTVLEMALPISTTFASSRNCAGSGSSFSTTIYGGNNIAIIGNSSANTAVFRLYPAGAASESYTFTFTYQVL